MNWAFYSTLSCPLKQPATVGGGRREEGSRSGRRPGREWEGGAGEPEEQAGHPRPAREAGPAEPWAVRPRPAVAMEPGRGGGQTGLPGRASLPGAPRRPRERPLYWRDDAFASGDAPFSLGWAWRKSPECPETFVCPSSHCAVWTVPPKGGLVHYFYSFGLLPFAPTLSLGEAKG